MEYLFAKPEEYKDAFSQVLDAEALYEISKDGLITYIQLNERPSIVTSIWHAKNLVSGESFQVTPNNSKLLKKVENPQELSKKVFSLSNTIRKFPKTKNLLPEEMIKAKCADLAHCKLTITEWRKRSLHTLVHQLLC